VERRRTLTKHAIKSGSRELCTLPCAGGSAVLHANAARRDTTAEANCRELRRALKERWLRHGAHALFAGGMARWLQHAAHRETHSFPISLACIT